MRNKEYMLSKNTANSPELAAFSAILTVPQVLNAQKGLQEPWSKWPHKYTVYVLLIPL